MLTRASSCTFYLPHPSLQRRGKKGTCTEKLLRLSAPVAQHNRREWERQDGASDGVGVGYAEAGTLSGTVPCRTISSISGASSTSFSRRASASRFKVAMCWVSICLVRS